jgi:hypothetical protein
VAHDVERDRGVAEELRARADDDRDDGEHELVDEAGGEQLPHEVAAAEHDDLAVPLGLRGTDRIERVALEPDRVRVRRASARWVATYFGVSRSTSLNGFGSGAESQNPTSWS